MHKKPNHGLILLFLYCYLSRCRIESHKSKSKDKNGKFDVDRINDVALLCERSLGFIYLYAIAVAHLCKLNQLERRRSIKINTRIKAEFL